MSPVPPRTDETSRPKAPLPASTDIAAEYHDFGGGVNPLGYKGHVFHRDGYGYSASPSPIPPSSIKYVSPPRIQHPVYDFDDNDDHDYSTARPATLPAEPQLPLHLRQSHLEPAQLPCTHFCGPYAPFMDGTTLSHVGSSTILPQNVYLLWRVCLLILSTTTAILTALQNLRYLGFLPGAAIFCSILSQVLLLRRAILYRKQSQYRESVTEKRDIYGWDAFIFQSTIHLCVIVGPIFALGSTFGPAEETALAGFGYIGSLSSYFLLALTALQVLDIFIVPVPFRITYVILPIIYGMLLPLISMRSYSRSLALSAIMLTALVGQVVGILLHMLGRAVYLLYHEERLSMKQQQLPTKPDLPPVKTDP